MSKDLKEIKEQAKWEENFGQKEWQVQSPLSYMRALETSRCQKERNLSLKFSYLYERDIEPKKY